MLLFVLTLSLTSLSVRAEKRKLPSRCTIEVIGHPARRSEVTPALSHGSQRDVSTDLPFWVMIFWVFTCQIQVLGQSVGCHGRSSVPQASLHGLNHFLLVWTTVRCVTMTSWRVRASIQYKKRASSSCDDYGSSSTFLQFSFVISLIH